MFNKNLSKIVKNYFKQIKIIDINAIESIYL